MLTVEALESRALLSGNGLDSTFNTGGDVVTDFGGVDVAAKVLIQPNGKIVAVGHVHLRRRVELRAGALQ
jgi:hypothetical protein